jgi:hypothetical protein
MFEQPVRLFRVGQGSISYSEPPGAGAGFINVAGARNGVSIDSGMFVVLGQDIGAAGNPAKLLSNREIPDEGLYINKWGAGGALNLTDAASPGVAGAKLFLQNAGDNLQLINGDITPATLSSQFALFTIAGVPAVFLTGSLDGHVNFNLFNTSSGDQVFGMDSTEIVGASAGGSIMSASPTQQASSGIEEIDVFLDQSTYENSGGTNTWISFASQPEILTTVAGDTFVGFQFKPFTASATPKYIAFENTIGNVLLCTSVAGAGAGRVGVKGVTTPTAYIHIGAGSAGVNDAPLKFTAGPAQAAPETGAMEFLSTAGNNLTFVRAATREPIVMGNTIAAPATTPGVAFTAYYGTDIANVLGDPVAWLGWINGATTYKIPLYS